MGGSGWHCGVPRCPCPQLAGTGCSGVFFWGVDVRLPSPPVRHRRNQNYSDILRSLALGDKRLSAFDLTLRFTHLFWFGDLNYRLDMDVQVGAPPGPSRLPPGAAAHCFALHPPRTS